MQRSGAAESSGDDGDDVDAIDVLIVAAIPLEHEAAKAGIDDWASCDEDDPHPYLRGEYLCSNGRRLSVALARPVRISGRRTGVAATALVDRLRPGCLAKPGRGCRRWAYAPSPAWTWRPRPSPPWTRPRVYRTGWWSRASWTHADPAKDDRYKRFAARASAEVLYALLDWRAGRSPNPAARDVRLENVRGLQIGDHNVQHNIFSG
jgi:hypothetical protein